MDAMIAATPTWEPADNTPTVTAAIDRARIAVGELGEAVKNDPGECECDELLAALVAIAGELPALVDHVAGWVDDLWPNVTPIALVRDRLLGAHLDLAAIAGIVEHVPARE